MQIEMQRQLGDMYKSNSQRARVVTEDWAGNFLYCAACRNDNLTLSPNNARAVDFFCGNCAASYQLKSSSRWSEHRVPDAGYCAMMEAINQNRTPNLLVLQYTKSWTVQNLVLIPSFFFAASAVQKRKPLGPSARRAGWVGCNILLSSIADEGKLRLINQSEISDTEEIRSRYKQLAPIANLDVSKRGWTLDVFRIVSKLSAEFTLDEVYAHEGRLTVLYPRNNYIRPKIRQQLQVLRDLNIIDFVGRGRYRKAISTQM